MFALPADTVRMAAMLLILVSCGFVSAMSAAQATCGHCDLAKQHRVKCNATFWSCKDHAITNFSLEYMPGRTVHDLDVSYNKLAVLRTGMFNNTQLLPLQYLNLSTNSISAIEKGALGQALVTLDLSYNPFTWLAFDTFKPLIHLELIYMRGNSLSDIPAEWVLTSLKGLHMEDSRNYGCHVGLNSICALQRANSTSQNVPPFRFSSGADVYTLASSTCLFHGGSATADTPLSGTCGVVHRANGATPVTATPAVHASRSTTSVVPIQKATGSTPATTTPAVHTSRSTSSVVPSQSATGSTPVTAKDIPAALPPHGTKTLIPVLVDPVDGGEYDPGAEPGCGYCDAGRIFEAHCTVDTWDCSHLGLTTFFYSQANLEGLTRLDFSRNELFRVNAGMFDISVVRHINVSRNNISAIALQAFNQELESLDLSYNPFTNLAPGTFDGMRELVKLYLRGNHLTDIPAKWAQLPVLQELNLEKSRAYGCHVSLKSICQLHTANTSRIPSVVPAFNFSSGLDVHTVAVVACDLHTRLPEKVQLQGLLQACAGKPSTLPSTAPPVSTASSKATTMTSAAPSTTSATVTTAAPSTSMPTTVTTETPSISSNAVTMTSPSTSQASTTTDAGSLSTTAVLATPFSPNCGHCSARKLDEAYCTTETWDCSNRSLTQFYYHPAVYTPFIIKFSGNALQLIDSLPSGIVSAFFDNNAIRNVTNFEHFAGGLQEFDLSSNILSSLHSGMFNRSKLAHLNLSKNTIVSIDSHAFGQGIVKLDLSYNPFTSLPSGTFDRLVILKELYLRGNRLFDIPAEWARLQSITTLRLEGSMNYGCQVLWSSACALQLANNTGKLSPFNTASGLDVQLLTSATCLASGHAGQGTPQGTLEACPVDPVVTTATPPPITTSTMATTSGPTTITPGPATTTPQPTTTTPGPATTTPEQVATKSSSPLPPLGAVTNDYHSPTPDSQQTSDFFDDDVPILEASTHMNFSVIFGIAGGCVIVLLVVILFLITRRNRRNSSASRMQLNDDMSQTGVELSMTAAPSLASIEFVTASHSSEMCRWENGYRSKGSYKWAFSAPHTTAGPSLYNTSTDSKEAATVQPGGMHGTGGDKQAGTRPSLDDWTNDNDVTDEELPPRYGEAEAVKTTSDVSSAFPAIIYEATVADERVTASAYQSCQSAVAPEVIDEARKCNTYSPLPKEVALTIPAKQNTNTPTVSKNLHCAVGTGVALPERASNSYYIDYNDLQLARGAEKVDEPTDSRVKFAERRRINLGNISKNLTNPIMRARASSREPTRPETASSRAAAGDTDMCMLLQDANMVCEPLGDTHVEQQGVAAGQNLDDDDPHYHHLEKVRLQKQQQQQQQQAPESRSPGKTGELNGTHPSMAIAKDGLYHVVGHVETLETV